LNAETIDRTVYEARRENLRKLMADNGLDALLVAHAANRFYLSGFELHDPQCNETAGWLLITRRGDDRLLTDPRYLEAAKRVWDEDKVFIYTPPKWENIRAYIKDSIGGDLGFESDCLTFRAYEELKELSPGPVSGLTESLRAIKDEYEIERIRRSCALNHKVMRQIEPLIVPGVTEIELAWEIEKLFRTQGASEAAFDPIVAVGRNAALPHASPGHDKVRENDLVLVDVGGRLDEYCSDQTRTFWVGGTPPDGFKRTLAQVREAQSRAIAEIGPGVKAATAYDAARNCFGKYGVADHFTHGLGHGVGLETHERPSLSAAGQGELAPGMVVTVEPGLYYPEWGGVRWEFMVLVTEDGCEVL
jgi:Xaa-Pro aminopeptidase